MCWTVSLGDWALSTRAYKLQHWHWAQINLFLRVMRRREDGYHDLASLFHVSEQVCAFGVAYRYWFWHMHLESPHPALVTGVRPAVQVIDLGDTMEFALLPPGAQQDELTCNMEGVPIDESNLVIKASLIFDFCLWLLRDIYSTG